MQRKGSDVATDVRRRVERRDRDWLNVSVEVICGPLEMPSVDRLRDAVTQLAEQRPDSRLTWSLDPGRRYWLNDRSAETVVVERDWDDAEDFSARLATIAKDPELSAPVTLIRYPRHIGLKMSHGIGDGRMFITAFCAPMYTAMLGAAVDWPIERGPRFPMVAAMANTFGKNPIALRRAFADRPVFAERAAIGSESPWQPSQRTRGCGLNERQVNELHEWRRRFVPGASIYAVQIVLLLNALNKVGIEVSDDVRMIADLRRYLRWQPMEGNFVAGVPMPIAAGMGPEQVSTIIKATNSSARPLAGYAMAALNRAGARRTAPTSVRRGDRPRIAFSSVGKPPALDGLPFVPGHRIEFTGAVVPEGPLGITVLMAETSRSMNFAVTFHDNVVDSQLVAAAMEEMSTDPVALLAGVTGGVR